MSRRAHALDHDHYGQPPTDQGVSGLGLFDPPPEPDAPSIPSWAETWGQLAPEQQKWHRDRWQQQLLPLVLEAAKDAGPLGITASEVITIGTERSILWMERAFVSRYPRIYSWVGAWLAQLARKGKLAPKTHHVEGHGTIHLTRESDRTLSHGNPGLIYLDVAVAAGRAA